MLIKLLLTKTGKLQLLGAIFGTITGMFLLLITFQFYFDADKLISNNKDLISPEFMVLYKNVSIFNTIGDKKATFTDSEIKNIKEQKFVKKASEFLSNKFKVFIIVKIGDSELTSGLFFEAIPDDYIDLEGENKKKWKWDPDNPELPIIIPRNYVNLYNFGFAPGQGLAQIPEKAFEMIPIKVRIRGNNKLKTLNAKIAGFSDRINSIMVPYSFLSWANENYGDQKGKMVSRVIIVTDDPSNPEILKFLKKNKYLTLKDKLKKSRISTILKIVLYVVGGISILIIFLSFFIFILSFRLLISKSLEKIKILLHLGYHYLSISKLYVLYFLFIVILVDIITILLLYITKIKLNNYIIPLGFNLSKNIYPIVIIAAISLSLMIFLVNSMSIIIQIKRAD